MLWVELAWIYRFSCSHNEINSNRSPSRYKVDGKLGHVVQIHVCCKRDEKIASRFLACSKRSDSGERCEVKKAMKSRGNWGERCGNSLTSLPLSLFFLSRSFLLGPAPHYLNAWNRLLNFQTCTVTLCDDYDGLNGDSPESLARVGAHNWELKENAYVMDWSWGGIYLVYGFLLRYILGKYKYWNMTNAKLR